MVFDAVRLARVVVGAVGVVADQELMAVQVQHLVRGYLHRFPQRAFVVIVGVVVVQGDVLVLRIRGG